MFNDSRAVRAYFLKLGLSSEIADIYLALVTYGPQSISELARRSGIERTRVYRLMDEMTASGLIEVETEYKKSIIRAAPASNLQILISKKEQEVHDLQAQLPQLNEYLVDSFQKTHTTRVQYYKGVDGLKQMYWNQTKSTKSEHLAILSENMQIRTNTSFFERWVRRCNEQSIAFRAIINDNFLKDQREWYGKHSNEQLHVWESRYLGDDVIALAYSTVIYDDVTSYYNWNGSEIFGVEIYNPEVADFQRQIFEMLWKQAQPKESQKVT